MKLDIASGIEFLSWFSLALSNLSDPLARNSSGGNNSPTNQFSSKSSASIFGME